MRNSAERRNEMRIDVKEFIINLNEQELYSIMFAFRDKFMASAEHCAMHTGMDTFYFNYRAEADTMRQMAVRLDRQFVYDECIKDLAKKIERIQSESKPA